VLPRRRNFPPSASETNRKRTRPNITQARNQDAPPQDSGVAIAFSLR
jgi:hypothetical protein